MLNPVRALVHKWSREDDSGRFFEIEATIDYLEKKLYNDYDPEIHREDFFIRLSKWLNNCSDDLDKKILFQLIPHIFYIGKQEFETLYRIAYNSQVARWLINSLNIKFTDEDIESRLIDEVKSTWFCPITDSFRINFFYNVNMIPATIPLRTDWKSLVEVGDPQKIVDIVSSYNIKRLVLLEDFVGSGTQISDAIKFAAEILPDFEILVVPLVICPAGIEKAKKLMGKYGRVKIESVLKIPSKAFIQKSKIVGEISIAEEIREFVKVAYDTKGVGKEEHNSAFGFKESGGLIVMHTNTPNNSLPIIYWSEGWNPLFKRHKRV